MRFSYSPAATHSGVHFRAVLWLGPIALRFGRHGWRKFSERNQGTRGIPRRFFYLFGGRLTIIRAHRPSLLAPSKENNQ